MHEKKSPSNLTWLAIAVAGLIALSCLVCTGGAALLLSGPEGGVRVASNMEEYAVEYVDEHGLLEPGEELIAYYDDTISLTGEEAAILTNRRVIQHQPTGTTSIALDQIADVRVSEDSLGTYVSVIGEDRSRLEIEIAVFNGGDIFADALLREWEANSPESEPTGATE